MTAYLTRADLFAIIEEVLPRTVTIRDHGQLQAATLRPQTTAFAEDAYPDLWEKAAALMQSLLIGRPLSDGDKRLAWTSGKAFLRYNGEKVGAPGTDAAYEPVVAVTTGEIVDVPKIADLLRALLRP